MSMLIRMATVQDAAELLEIYRPYVEETSITFETEVPTEVEFAERIAEILSRFPYLVAEEDGRLLGYAYAHPFHQRAAYGWTVESSVYVRKDVRHGHIGTLLYEKLLSMLRAQGVRNVCAVITVPNAPSMAFHKKLGFEIGGVLPDFGYKLGRWHGVSYLYRSLGGGAEAPAPLKSVWELPEALRMPDIFA